MKERGLALQVLGAYILACVAIGMSGYAVFMWPERTRLKTEEIKAKTEATLALAELAAGIGSIVEHLDKEDQLEALQRVTNESNRRLKELRNANK